MGIDFRKSTIMDLPRFEKGDRVKDNLTGLIGEVRSENGGVVTVRFHDGEVTCERSDILIAPRPEFEPEVGRLLPNQSPRKPRESLNELPAPLPEGRMGDSGVYRPPGGHLKVYQLRPGQNVPVSGIVAA